MEKIKKAFRFGDPNNALYQQDIDRLRREHEEHVMYQQMMNTAQVTHNSALGMQNAAQNAIQGSPYQQGAIQGSGYQSGWNDPRASMLRGAVPITSEEALVNSIADTNRALSRMADRLERQERRIDMLSGFYQWVTEVHPEIAAQHKAMRDLYEAANAPQQEQGKAS